MPRRTLTKEEFNALLHLCANGERRVLTNQFVPDGFWDLGTGDIYVNPGTRDRMVFTVELLREEGYGPS